MASLFRSIAAGIESKSTDISALTWAKLWGDDMSAKSGVSVNLEAALKVSTVLAGARVHSEGVGQLPFKLYRERADGGKDVARDHSLHRVIARRPNEWMTSYEFRELLTFRAVLTGNGYAWINRTRGEVTELLPLVCSVTPKISKTWELSYDIDGIGTDIPRTHIFHLRGPSITGIAGLDAVQTAREAIGLAIATEETHARLHSNGAQPGGVLAVDGQMSEASYNRVKAQIEESRKGLSNAFKTWVLDQGAKWHPLAMKGVDAQHLETRKFQIEEICRDLRVMPVMLSHPADIAARAAMEQLFIAHVVYYLMPWLVRWEQAVDRDLIGDNDDGLFSKFTVAGLMRGALKDQGEYFAKALGSGGSPAWLTQDEVRDLLEFNPIGGTASQLATPTNPAVSPSDKTPTIDESQEDDEQ